MKKILILSDTHGYIGNEILEHAKKVDEVWHAGDIGNENVLKSLQDCATVRAVYGNIDGSDIRLQTKKELLFEVEGVKVLMTHIGGYPNRYETVFRQTIIRERPNIVVVGHSHICKVMSDKTLRHLHINPGAIGVSGFHSVRTMLLLDIENSKPQNLRVVEYKRK